MTERRFALVQLDGGPSAPGCAAGVLHDFSERRIHPLCHLCRCRVDFFLSGNERGGVRVYQSAGAAGFASIPGEGENEPSFLHDKGILEKTKSQLVSAATVQGRRAETETAGR